MQGRAKMRALAASEVWADVASIASFPTWWAADVALARRASLRRHEPDRWTFALRAFVI